MWGSGAAAPPLAMQCNAKLHSYYSPALVRQGVTTLQQALHSNMKVMPQGWKEVYQQQIQWLQQQPVQELPNVWSHLALGAFLSHLKPLG